MPANKNDTIRRIKHDDIDKLRWNRLMESVPGCPVYSFSWYLDIVAGTWDALICGDYQYVMPVPFRSKWGLSYIYQPFFTQQLGIFPPAPDYIQRAFGIQLARKFPFISYQATDSLLPEKFRGFTLKQRRNRYLPLLHDYAILSGGYPDNTRRNLKKAERKGISVKLGNSSEEYVRLKKKHTRGNVPEDSFRILGELVGHSLAEGKGQIRLACDPGGEITAGAFLLFHQNMVYYLNAFSSDTGMENGSAFTIVDGFIREFAGTGMILDFEGSEIEGIDRFYRGFGALEKSYFHISRSRVPFFMIRLMKKLTL